ncbi:MAG: hypothetical protein EOS10_22595 [Mesorhizobium sp.]|uniref:hypothetical protein n=1 Tax=Mesorhizobium sp. TaxID=1871066 RepID=UPI000FE4A04A|nr:hypothetical protein [Mesorhizobium sp.]RWO29633.1 MAG: hypothetical protein EOS10_22595 [Mesorhizobium sp.]
MTDRSILFSGPMVRALLAGTKFQTRRVIDFPSIDKVVEFVRIGFERDTGVPIYEMKDAGDQHLFQPTGKHLQTPHWSPRFAVGDRLYVREAWRSHAAYDDISPAAMGGDEAILYVADDAHQTWGYPAITKLGRFRQGMHMPRWASRLTLAVTDVRVQRLQDIREADAIAEGCPISTIPGTIGHPLCQVGFNEMGTPIFWYRKLWNNLNADRGFGWETNPWVVAVTFTVERRNIDEARP